MDEKKSGFDSFLTNLLAIIYSKDKKIERLLILIVLIGFILRFIAAINMDFLADDAMYAAQSAGIINAGILSTHSHPPLFFYLNDAAYNLLGYTTLAARLIPLIAGTLLIIIIYLIATKLFNNKIGLASAFLAAISNFMIKLTFTEHSALVFFLSFFGLYIGLLFLETNNKKYLISAGVLFGLATLTKYNGPFFLIAFCIFAYYHFASKKINAFEKEKVKSLVILLGIVAVLSLPFIFFNYIIYQEKGLLDFQFANILRKPSAMQLYAGLGGGGKSFTEAALNPESYSNIFLVLKTDLILAILAIFGSILMFIRKEKYPFYFLFLVFIIPFFLQSVGSTLAKHFEFMHVVASIFAGYALVSIKDRLNNEKLFSILILVLTLLMLFNISSNNYAVPGGIIEKSASSQVKAYINNNIESNDLIVFDSRIYTPRTFWLATDNNFITMQQFPVFYNYNLNLSKSQLVPTKVYFVECAIDDCGWGVEKVRGALNDSEESMFSQIKNISKLSYETLDSKGTTFKVYQTELNLNREIVKSIKYNQAFFFAPYLYVNMKDYIFNYDKSDYSLMHNTSIIIIQISMILVVLSFLYVIYLLFSKDHK